MARKKNKRPNPQGLTSRHAGDGPMVIEYCSGLYTESELAKKYGVTKFHMWRTVENYTKRWEVEARRAASYHRGRVLAEFQEIKALSMEAYAKSRGERVTKTHEVVDAPDGKRTKASHKTEVLNGDPRFLTVALSCLDLESKLLGLNAPTKIAATTPDGEDSPLAVVKLDKMTEQQLLAYQELVTQVLDVESQEVK